jgi:hypothetical protein
MQFAVVATAGRAAVNWSNGEMIKRRMEMENV